MTLNYPWKVYKFGTYDLICFHYISETKTKKEGDLLNTTEGKFTIKRIDNHSREIWV